MARTRGLAMWLRPNFPDLAQIPLLLATLIDMMISCLVSSIAAAQALRSSSSSALDFAIVAQLRRENDLEVGAYSYWGKGEKQVIEETNSNQSQMKSNKLRHCKKGK